MLKIHRCDKSIQQLVNGMLNLRIKCFVLLKVFQKRLTTVLSIYKKGTEQLKKQLENYQTLIVFNYYFNIVLFFEIEC